MMGKVNIDKTSGHAPIRPERQADVRPGKHEPIKPASTETKVGDDQVRVSEKAAEFNKLVSQVRELPDVRADKVENVRGRVEAGTFRPTGGDIAQAILKDERS